MKFWRRAERPVEEVRTAAIQEFLDAVMGQIGVYESAWKSLTIVAAFDGPRLQSLRSAACNPGSRLEEIFLERRLLRRHLEALVLLFEDVQGQVPQALVFWVEGTYDELSFRMDLAYEDDEAARFDVEQRGFDVVMRELDPFS